MVKLTVYGAPRTKKNSLRRFRPKGSNRTLSMPSKAWTEWNRTAHVEGKPSEPITYEVNCFAIFYRDALRGDAVGYYQGLADLLEKHGVVDDDKRIVSWDGSRLLKDAKNPRVEVELLPAD